jgi:predicted CXXCH cytochrome family protein
LSGGQINCTDCHGNNDASGARGPHGSSVRHLLKANYVTTDGIRESPTTYALCYRCHNREAVLRDSRFEEHREHIDNEDISCASCHNPHGSVGNRALIRFGSGLPTPGVAPSARTGRLEFISTSPGSGACYLTCHGEDHDPKTYGGFGAVVEPTGSLGDGPTLRPFPERSWPPPLRRPPAPIEPPPPEPPG